jgi:hypothetical protein
VQRASTLQASASRVIFPMASDGGDQSAIQTTRCVAARPSRSRAQTVTRFVPARTETSRLNAIRSSANSMNHGRPSMTSSATRAPARATPATSRRRSLVQTASVAGESVTSGPPADRASRTRCRARFR